MTQGAQVGAVYRTSQDLLDADLPHLAVVVDARGYAIQRDADGNWYSVASVNSSDLVGAYTLVHLPAEPLPATSGSVVITEAGTPFMRRWGAEADDRSRPDRWIGPDGVTLSDGDLRGLGIARTWDAGTADGTTANGRLRDRSPAASRRRH
ncbi:hypothetical protein [Myceligenerans xiligouense]|uniref:Uncharacterized protein n=1 Tax=Myceligenerans xiligouense TaxID=253184 RepID=A0A3N4Z4X2_9MICO|nr:hypothetical protein [Myceligenerans xiligouense]RPF20968.1 hypothetical protein EDD34_1576 [Myceligenerans xiligouense]